MTFTISDIMSANKTKQQQQQQPVSLPSPVASPVMQNQPPTHISTIDTTPIASSNPTSTPRYSKKRDQVKTACTNCANACKKCADIRPCPRCVRLNLSDTCVDRPKRARRKGFKRGSYNKAYYYTSDKSPALKITTQFSPESSPAASLPSPSHIINHEHNKRIPLSFGGGSPSSSLPDMAVTNPNRLPKLDISNIRQAPPSSLSFSSSSSTTTPPAVPPLYIPSPPPKLSSTADCIENRLTSSSPVMLFSSSQHRPPYNQQTFYKDQPLSVESPTDSPIAFLSDVCCKLLNRELEQSIGLPSPGR